MFIKKLLGDSKRCWSSELEWKRVGGVLCKLLLSVFQKALGFGAEERAARDLLNKKRACLSACSYGGTYWELRQETQVGEEDSEQLVCSWSPPQ